MQARSLVCAAVCAGVFAAAACRDWEDLSRNYRGADAGECWGGGRARCPDGLLTCDSFETGSLAREWAVVPADAGVAIDATCPNRGEYSVHITTPAAGPSVTVRAQLRTDVVGVQFNYYARAYFFLPEGLQSAQTTLIDLAQPISINRGVLVQFENGVLGIRNTVPASPVESWSTVPVPIGRWTCIELQVQVGADQPIRLYLDDAEVLDIRSNTETSPPLGRISFGRQGDSAAGQPAQEIWVDDVAVDLLRIGCVN